MRTNRHLANFVEQQRASFGEFETSGATFERAGECTFLMAEDFAFNQSLRDSRTIDGNKRLIAARTQIMNGAGDKFLASPTGARDQDRRGTGRDLLDQVKNLLHRRRRTDQRTKRPFIAQTPAERLVFHARIQNLADVGQNGAQTAKIDRLLDVVLYAEAAGMEGVFGRSLRGHHHDRYGLRKLGETLHQFHAAHTGHLDVGDHDGRSKRCHLIERLHAIRGGFCAVAPPRDQLRQAGALVHFVFNDQYSFLCHRP